MLKTTFVYRRYTVSDKICFCLVVFSVKINNSSTGKGTFWQMWPEHKVRVHVNGRLAPRGVNTNKFLLTAKKFANCSRDKSSNLIIYDVFFFLLFFSNSEYIFCETLFVSGHLWNSNARKSIFKSCFYRRRTIVYKIYYIFFFFSMR